MPPGLATTCAGNATWMCLSGGFRKDPRPCVLGWHLNVSEWRISKGPATMRAGVGGGVPPERTCDSAFDHARWAGHLDVLDRRISGHSRLCALGWIQGSAPERRISKGPATIRAGAGKGFRKCLLSCHPDGAQPPGLRLRLPPRALGAPCQYFRDAAAERYSLRSSHRKLALLPECRGSERERTPEASSSTAQGR